MKDDKLIYETTLSKPQKVAWIIVSLILTSFIIFLFFDDKTNLLLIIFFVLFLLLWLLAPLYSNTIHIIDGNKIVVSTKFILYNKVRECSLLNGSLQLSEVNVSWGDASTTEYVLSLINEIESFKIIQLGHKPYVEDVKSKIEYWIQNKN